MSKRLSGCCAFGLQSLSLHRYSEEVERYFEVYLKTPGLTSDERAKALLARGNAVRRAGERLLARAQQGTDA